MLCICSMYIYIVCIYNINNIYTFSEAQASKTASAGKQAPAQCTCAFFKRLWLELPAFCFELLHGAAAALVKSYWLQVPSVSRPYQVP